jgi:hypothetical protein
VADRLPSFVVVVIVVVVVVVVAVVVEPSTSAKGRSSAARQNDWVRMRFVVFRKDPDANENPIDFRLTLGYVVPFTKKNFFSEEISAR